MPMARHRYKVRYLPFHHLLLKPGILFGYCFAHQFFQASIAVFDYVPYQSVFNIAEIINQVRIDQV